MTCRFLCCILLVLLLVVPALVVFARGEEEASVPVQEAGPELPQLVLVAGAQDLWPFEFGFDATRESLAVFLGAAETISRDELLETWQYEGFEITFFVDSDQELELLMSVRITSEEVPLRGGVSLGMSRAGIVDLMG